MSEPKIRLSQVSPSASGNDRITGNVTITGSVNVATANITTIVTGNALTLSTGTGSNGNIIFSANGTEDMRITAPGNIGIGTSNPGRRFHTYINGSDVARFEGSSTFIDIDGNGNQITGSNALRFRGTTSGDPHLLITSSGNVGIGTTNPTTHNGSNALVIRGGSGGRGIIELHDGAGSGKAVFQQVANTTFIGNLAGAGDLRLLVNGNGSNATEALNILANGNVGISTTSPGVKLDVFAGDISIRASEGVNTRDSRFLRIFRGSYGGDQAGVIFGTGPSTENWFIGHPYSGGGVFNALIISEKPVIFDGNAALQKTPSMYFSTGAGTAAGNVGIGTTNPTAQGLTIHQGGGDRRVLLELNRPNTPGLQTAIEFTVGGSIMVGRIQHEYEAANQNHMSFSLRSPGSANFEVLRLKNDGNIGIGTTNPGEMIELYKVDGAGDLGIRFHRPGLAEYKVGIDDTTEHFYITNNNGPTGLGATEDGIIINSSGIVRMGKQPAFVAHADTNQEPTSTTKLAYTGITLNRGNHYNSSTSRFTAPVTGIYSFNVRWWYKVNATGMAQLFVYKNGSAVIETRFKQAASVSEYITQLFKTTMYLIAGDYIEVYGSGNGTDSFHSSTSYYYSEFSGYLLG